MNKILIIIGPTLSKKTHISIKLANEFISEIISIDASCIYKKLDIGTAKPSYYQLKKIKHHMINIINPDNKFSVGEFFNRSINICDYILRKKNIIFSGGTMMYYNILRNGLINKKTKEKKFFPYTFNTIKLIPYNKNIYFKLIEERITKMINKGLIEETICLYKKNLLNEKFNSYYTIGYKNIIELVIKKKINDINIIKNEIFSSTKKLIKKQFTWLKKWNIISFNSLDKNVYKNIRAHIINKNLL